MRPVATFALWFSSAVLATCIAWAAIGVYVLGEYERAWGANSMFLVVAGLSLAVSLATLFSSGLGAKLGGMSRRAPRWIPVALGLLFVFGNFLLGKVMEAMGFPPNRVAAILWVVFVPALIAFIAASRFREKRL